VFEEATRNRTVEIGGDDVEIEADRAEDK